MKKLNNLMILGKMRLTDTLTGVLGKRKQGSDEMVMKVGLIAVALLIFGLWKAGATQLVSGWIEAISQQSQQFWN